jgi:hypothetical protein
LIQITDRTDFATRLAYFMTAQQHLVKSGIKPTGESLEEATDKFLDQFDAPAKNHATVPLPPSFKHPTAWAARNKSSGGTLSGTATTYSIDAETLLNAKIPPECRDQYEIIPLYPND